MAFSVKSAKTGETYYLHSQTTPTKSGTRTIYFFAKQVKDGALESVPTGYVPSESANGLPVLKKAVA